MRKQIAAANWKMNLAYSEAESLLNNLNPHLDLIKEHPGQYVVLGVPFPYLQMACESVQGKDRVMVSAQNCHDKNSGAYTGEVSAAMIASVHAGAVIIGHSERREYNHETDAIIAEKINRTLEQQLTPIFCCGEPLPVREAGEQNAHVASQLEGGLFHLSAEQLQKIVIAYEPIWAIGTGKTASSAQAQEMHAFIRSVLAKQFGADIASTISILYGGSVKGANAAEIFSQPDVDGGLVGGASLNAAEFAEIIKALKTK